VVGGGNSDLGKRIQKTQKQDLAKINDGIDYEILDEFLRVMKKVNCFIWCSKLQIFDILKFFLEQEQREIYYEILTWNKSNPTPVTNNVWLPDIEYCLYFREKGVPLNDGYDIKSKWYSSPINKRDKDLFEHPTIKPLELVKRHLLHTTQVGDVVLDTFIGSGTTAVACKETERQFVGFEIDEKWYKIANDRLDNIDANGQISWFTK
jgi:DNA modification methylase